MSYNYIVVNPNSSTSFNYTLYPNTILTGDLNGITIPDVNGKYNVDVISNSVHLSPINPFYTFNYTFTHNRITENQSFVYNNINEGIYMLTINAQIVETSNPINVDENTTSGPAIITYSVNSNPISNFKLTDNTSIVCNDIVVVGENNTLQIDCSFINYCHNHDYSFFKIILIPITN